MRRISIKIYLIIILIYPNFITATKFSDDKIKSNSDIKKEEKGIIINFPDTIKLKNISENKKDDFFSEKNMPWMVALLIGIISAYINYIISKKLRDSNEKNINLQIQNATRITEIQINQAKENALIQFKTTIKTKNEQEWLNDLRNALAEFLTYTFRTTPDLELSDDERDKRIDKIFSSMFKIELFLDTNEKEEDELLKSLKAIIKILILKKEDYNTSMIKDARKACLISSRNLINKKLKIIKEINV